MSINENSPLSSDPSSLPVVSGLSPLVAGPATNLGWPGGPQAGAEASAAINVLTYVHALRRHWLMACSLGLVCAGSLGVLSWLVYGAQYTASAFFNVAPNQESIVFEDQNAKALAAQNFFDSYKETQSQLVKHRFVLQKALRKTEIAALPSVKRNEPDPVGWLAGELKVGFARNSQIMQVSLTGSDPEEVAKLVNAVVDAYTNEVVDKERKQRVIRKNQLDQLCAEKETDVRNKRNELKQTAEQFETSDTEALSMKQVSAAQELADYGRELLTVQFDLMRNRSALKAAQAYSASLADAEISAAELDSVAYLDPMSRQLTERLMMQKMAMDDIKAKLVPGSNSRYIKKYQTEMEVIQAQVDKLGKDLRTKIRDKKRTDVEREIERLKSEVSNLTEQQEELHKAVEQKRKEAERIGKKSIEVEMMRNEIHNLEQVLTSVEGEREKLKVEINAASRITLLQAADVPEVESGRSIRMVMSGMAALAGFFLPVVGIMFWDTRSRRVNAVAEVAQGLGLPVIGSVPTIPTQVLRRLGAATKRSQSWRLRLTESIDSIAARLLHKAETMQSRVILVSSAMGGEGKTTLATQVAMSLARHLRRTVLVDFDLRRPALDGVFGLPLEPGVCDVLRDKSDVTGMIHPTTTDHLSVLPAGQWDRQAMAALANGAAGPLFKQLREQYDFVIVDSSPVLPVADTRFVSQHADTVILSVFRDLSEVPKIQATCEILEAFGVRNLVTVVTGRGGFTYGRERDYASTTPA